MIFSNKNKLEQKKLVPWHRAPTIIALIYPLHNRAAALLERGLALFDIIGFDDEFRQVALRESIHVVDADIL